MSETRMSIALLSQAGESGRHLREALVGSGAPIVYEAQAAELDRDALERSGARVVVVNLDSEVEAHLDEVYSLLGDDRYNVIFNEAQVSSQLSGWEQARWARHLAAKILGAANVDPPRPEGAEPVPQRAPLAPAAAPTSVPREAQIVEQSAAEPEVIEQATAAEESAEPVEPMAAVEEIEVSEFDDFADIASLLNEVDPEPLEVARAVLPQKPQSEVDRHDTVPMPVLDLSEFDLDPEPAVEADVRADEPSLSVRAEETREIPAFELPTEFAGGAEEGGALGFADLDDFADGADAMDGPVADAGVHAAGHASNPLDAELAQAAATGDAAVEASVSELHMLDLDWADTPAAPAPGTAKEILEDVPLPALGSAFAWSLEDLDDGGEKAPPSVGDESAQPREFGIETISPSEFLAPEVDEVVDEPFDTGLSLELIPLDEAVAPQPGGSDPALQAGRETWLDISSKAVISRVWVLGASIGGPEAVREFLAEIPAKCPALFLLAQHMGAEFMDIMSQQLARSTPLSVRTPSHGERVAHGDIVVVPVNQRLRVDREGVITLEAIKPGSLPNSPSIDQVIADVADRFAAKAGVIVFSGMAEDAAEGCRHLASKGGKVYVQDPDTCVISSMVDGVIETGVVTFAGSPKALAEKVLGDFKVA